MKLSRRLQTVASFVSPGSRIVDVGTDHGYIPIYLVQNAAAVHAIAMDIKKGPLDRAKAHIAQFHLEEQIETRLSDGLKELKPGEGDTVILAGMGGALTVRILQEGHLALNQIKEIILSPQSELDRVRKFLQANGFVIVKESMVCEENKYYTVMKAVKGNMNYRRYIDFKYGKLLLEEKNSVLREFLRKERKKLEEVKCALQNKNTEAAQRRLGELEKELFAVMEAEYEMSGNY